MSEIDRRITEKLSLASQKYDSLQGVIITLKGITETLLKAFKEEYRQIEESRKDILALDLKLKHEKIIKFVHGKLDDLFDDYDHMLSGDFFNELKKLKDHYAKEIKSGKVATVVQKLLIIYDNAITLHGKLIKENHATLKFISEKSAEIESLLKQPVEKVLSGLNGKLEEFREYIERKLDSQRLELEKTEGMICTSTSCKASKAESHHNHNELVPSHTNWEDEWYPSVDL